MRIQKRTIISVVVVLILAAPFLWMAVMKERSRAIWQEDRAKQQHRQAMYEKNRFRFEPDSCPEDAQGMIHIAIADIVFRLPYEKVKFKEGWTVHTEGGNGRIPEMLKHTPASPKPSEPEGCLGNPVRGYIFSVEIPFPTRKQPDYVVHAGGAYAEPGCHAYDEFHKRNKEYFEHICSTYKRKFEHSNGLIECRYDARDAFPKQQLGPAIEQRNFGYLVSLASDSKKVASLCGHPLVYETDLNTGGGYYYTRYYLSPSVGIGYGWQRQFLDFDEVVPLANRIDTYFKAAIITNYPWPNKDKVQ